MTDRDKYALVLKPCPVPVPGGRGPAGPTHQKVIDGCSFRTPVVSTGNFISCFLAASSLFQKRKQNTADDDDDGYEDDDED